MSLALECIEICLQVNRFNEAGALGLTRSEAKHFELGYQVVVSCERQASKHFVSSKQHKPALVADPAANTCGCLKFKHACKLCLLKLVLVQAASG